MSEFGGLWKHKKCQHALKSGRINSWLIVANIWKKTSKFYVSQGHILHSNKYPTTTIHEHMYIICIHTDTDTDTDTHKTTLKSKNHTFRHTQTYTKMNTNAYTLTC